MGETGEMGGCGVDRTGWGRGEVSRRAKARLKGTRKGFYYSQVIHGKFQIPRMPKGEAFMTSHEKSAMCKAVFTMSVSLYLQ